MEQYLVQLEEVSVTPVSLEISGEALIMNKVSFGINRGEWITVIGSNGSGKSTLLKVISGMLRLGVSGKVKRNREKLSTSPIPIVMQQPEAGIIGSTPWEDVVIMLERHGVAAELIQGKIVEVLEAVGLKERMNQPVETLSGGQKQLLAIAGCLAVQAPLLLLDEVTTMLDPSMSIFVLDKVRELHQSGVSIIWITQKLEELREQDRAIVLKEGTIVFDGKAPELFQRKRLSLEESVCESLGFEAPYAVQVAWELEKEGIQLSPLPLTIEQLTEAVVLYDR
ncbi:ATP-binding cassette domain-containing protein [Paenibacillus sp. GSMTC-2017]|uniref:ATP-binding cassette domain-containing protein n=1 Tax=Paenibacillus sp. GSMTC-2017 TaxID=2794350 RepID=UPI0018D8BE8F|nr:ATP-binding cassette domain-containing protein [Paenibacillus sp. GSMTC-2017]MBH5316550.1 ATP-binding cassette domain-containing protein [Paenibacillus sp. GSMTC-2017]